MPTLQDVLNDTWEENRHARLAAILDHYLQDPDAPPAGKGQLRFVLDRYPSLAMWEKIIRFCDDAHICAPRALLEIIREAEADYAPKYLDYLVRDLREVKKSKNNVEELSPLPDTDGLVGYILSELGYPWPRPPRGGLPDLLEAIEFHKNTLKEVKEPRAIAEHVASILRIGRTILEMLVSFYAWFAFRGEYQRHLAALLARSRRAAEFLATRTLDEWLSLLTRFQDNVDGELGLKQSFEEYFGPALVNLPERRFYLLPEDKRKALEEACTRKQECGIFAPRLKRIGEEHFEEIKTVAIGIANALADLRELYDRVFPTLILIRTVTRNEAGELSVYFVDDHPESGSQPKLLRVNTGEDHRPGERALYWPWTWKMRELEWPGEAPEPVLTRRGPLDDDPLLFYPEARLFRYGSGQATKELEEEADKDTEMLRTRLHLFETTPRRYGYVYLYTRFPAPFNHLIEIFEGEVYNDASLAKLIQETSPHRREDMRMEFKASAYVYEGMVKGEFNQLPIAKAIAAFANSAAIGEIKGGVLFVGIPDDPDKPNDRRIAEEMREELSQPGRDKDIVDKIMRTASGRWGKQRCSIPVKCHDHLLEASRIGVDSGKVLLLVIPQQELPKGPVRVRGEVYMRSYGESITASPEWIASWSKRHEDFWRSQRGG